MTSADLVVLGGGPAGVGAAYRAARAGRSVVLLEGSPALGGAAASHEVAGLRVDLGSHRLHASVEPRILADLRALLGADLQRRPRDGRIRLCDRWIAFPLRPADLARRLPPSVALGALRDAALAPARRARGDTFADVLRAALGPTLCRRFYFPYARKIWGVDPEELAGEQARRRVAARSHARLLRRAAGGGRRGFWYPRRGYGQISEALGEAAARAGAEIRLGARAQAVELRPDGATVRLAGGGAVSGRMVWSTIPLTALARMAEPTPPPDALAAAAGLRHRAMALAYLVLDRPRYTPFDAHYLPGGRGRVTRLSEPRNYRDGDDPPGRTVLCAELPCDPGDDLWGASDAELGGAVAEAMAEAGLPDPAPVAVAARRLSHAYPVMRVGFEQPLATLDAWAAAEPALLTFGRQGLFVHDNAHQALAMAWAAADLLRPDGTVDRRGWATARERFAGHVVED